MYINKDIKPSLLDPNNNDDKLEKENIETLGIISKNVIKMSGKILLISALATGIGISVVEASIPPENAICQISIFFLFPLGFAMIHSFFGMKFSAIIMQTIGVGSNFRSLLITGGFLVLIYGGYFVVTYLCSKNMIKESLVK